MKRALVFDIINNNFHLKHMIKKETIQCSAIWYDDKIVRPHQPKNINSGIVVCGLRHSNCFPILRELFPDKEYEESCVQGFLTSSNRFVDREEGAIIAYESEQIVSYKIILFSEDLW